MSKVTVDLQMAFDGTGVPSEALFEAWAEAAWQDQLMALLLSHRLPAKHLRDLCRDLKTNFINENVDNYIVTSTAIF